MTTFNQSHFDSTEKRISLVYNSDISGYQALDFSKLNDVEDLVRNSFPIYDSIELYYNGSNNTGVYYKQNGSLVRMIELKYDGSNNITGVFTTNY